MLTSTKNILLLLGGLALLVVIGWLIVIMRPLLVALTIAAVLAYLLNPVVERFTVQFGGRRSVAASFVYVCALIIFFGPFALLAIVASDQWLRVQRELGQALRVMQGWLTRPFPLFGYRIDPEVIWQGFNSSWSNTLSSLTIGSDGLLSSLTENLLWALVVFVSLYYLLKDGHRIKPSILALVPERYQADAHQLADAIDEVWGIFLRVQLFIFAVLTVLVVSSTALIVWLFRQGWLPLSPFGVALLMIGVYTAIQQVDNLWLRPQLMGHALKLHPGIIFVGLITGLALSGILGAILIVPILATLKVIGRFIYVRLPIIKENQLPLSPQLPPTAAEASTQIKETADQSETD